LTRDELELMNVPGNSALLRTLLPETAVSVGDTWTISNKQLAPMLGLDAITQSAVTGRLRDVKDEIAIVDVNGKLSGAVGGIATEIEITGKMDFNLQNRNVSRVAFSIKENRSIGHADAGYDVTAQIRIALAPSREIDELTDKSLHEFPLDRNAGSELLRFDSMAGGFRMLLDRRWRVMADQPKLTVLRFIDRGDLVAQCNMSKLPELEQGKKLQLEELQNDVRQALGENFGQFIEASQYVSDSGIRVLRAVAIGKVADLPIQWRYYHLSNDEGERLAIVFTLEEELGERFANADQMLIQSLEFKSTSGSVDRSARSQPARAPGVEKLQTGYSLRR
jgi:hypothetical protein